MVVCFFCLCRLKYNVHVVWHCHIVVILYSTCTCILQALVQEDPNYVVKRYESRKYAIDESVTSEYLKVGCLGLMSTKTEMEDSFLSFLHCTCVQDMYLCDFTVILFSFMLCPKVAAMLNTPIHLNTSKGVVVVDVIIILFL